MGATINIYLTFNGKCKEAFDFYKSIFGGEFQQISTFSEMPPQKGMPPIKKEEKDRIMHVSLPINKESVLMGSDTGGEWVKDFKKGNNFSISVSANTKDEADKFFRGLSNGGNVKMPMDKTFWGSYFGMLEDKFGINWMVNFDEDPHQ
jgi:PhnB protein